MAFDNLIGLQRCSAVSRETACKCFTVSLLVFYIKLFKVLIKTNENISNELNFSEVYRRVASEIYINPFWVNSLCTRPNVVYASINLRTLNNNMEPRDVHDVKINHASVQSDWTSALFRS